MSEGGWIKSTRSDLDNPYLQELDVLGLYDRFMRMAAWKDDDVFCRKRKRVIRLKRGQLWVSTRDLAKMCSSQKRARTILKTLEMGTLIGTETGTGITIVTICNYDEIQAKIAEGAQPGARQGAHEGHGRGTQIEEDKESIEDKKEESCPLGSPDGDPGDGARSPPDRFPKFDRLPKNGVGSIYPPEFEQFWRCFPRRPTDTKKIAYSSWRTKALDRRVGVAMLQDGVERYAAFIERSGHEPKLIKSWINSEGWTATLHDAPKPRKPHGNDHRSSEERLAERVARELAEADAMAS